MPTKMRVGLVTTMLVMAATSAQAQLESDEAVMERGRLIAEWIYDSQADSLWNAMGETMRSRLGDIDAIYDRLDQLAVQMGMETEVTDERIEQNEGTSTYYRVVEFETGPGPMQWRMVIATDGTVDDINLEPVPQPAASP